MDAVSTNSASSPLLVVGLGNPGADYSMTRHNIGAMVLDDMADSFSLNKKVNAHVVETRLGGRRVILAKPRSYMNLSGGPVKALAGYYKVTPAQILVVHDELDLDLGTVTLKKGGGLGGHNGLKDIAKSLGTQEFLRIRVGIGRPPGRMAPASFVLKPFTKAEQPEVPIMCADAADLIVGVATGEVSV
ncbi:aminoacyl-tRNA hydrolase [Corynebacterium terpenotabidum]|uniref:Peptidyl-tRNA hydrolase n=1 Tax=Corynebacterium terpenotabidum Y-11 TaxID=1200352 RepID=S4XDN5_9CORY|nr:aminoacyl-tRNA hydrolase [Corynebacterium terpenotabidum]AGP31262.1 peptidyl-tRNA hydrolase [Corynebacterium terpenotabidum Y-11]